MPASEPVINVPMSPQKQVEKVAKIESGLLSDKKIIQVNQIRNGIKQKVQIINSFLHHNTESKFTKIRNEKCQMKSEKQQTNPSSEFRKSYKNQPCNEFPNIDNSSSISQNFQVSRHSHHRKKDRPNHGKGIILKSAPKPIKMVDSLEKELH